MNETTPSWVQIIEALNPILEVIVTLLGGLFAGLVINRTVARRQFISGLVDQMTQRLDEQTREALQIWSNSSTVDDLIGPKGEQLTRELQMLWSQVVLLSREYRLSTERAERAFNMLHEAITLDIERTHELEDRAFRPGRISICRAKFYSEIQRLKL